VLIGLAAFRRFKRRLHAFTCRHGFSEFATIQSVNGRVTKCAFSSEMLPRKNSFVSAGTSVVIDSERL